MNSKIRLNLTSKLLLTTLVLFGIFTLVLIGVQRNEERNYRKAILNERLDVYADMVHEWMFDGDSLTLTPPALPNEVRVTLIDDEGKVLYDTRVSDVSSMRNHGRVPEVLSARYHDYGSDIRVSETTKEPTLYHAKYYGNAYVRTALPYDASIKSSLKATPYFIVTTIILYILVSLLLLFFNRRYNRALQRLRNLSRDIKMNRMVSDEEYTDDELGEISLELMEILRQKEEAKQELVDAKERLIRHFNLSKIGIAMFDKQGHNVYSNSHFIQYINMMAVHPIVDLSELLDEEELAPIKTFLAEEDSDTISRKVIVHREHIIFEIRGIKAGDGSYEITIEDITEEEKNHILKQEMTSNIAHEIRTPVAVMRGYLETLMDKEIPLEQRQSFVNKAYNQALKLSELMEDIRLLSKMEERNESFTFEEIDLYELVESIREDKKEMIVRSSAHLENALPQETFVPGNRTLLLSIFNNIIENSLKYGGKNITIHIECYHEDDSFLYFSIHDTGAGVDVKHLNRIFERFYRVDEGRCRTTGGTGLGLSIVRNAIHMHGGEVQARRHKSGGLEILFNLRKQAPGGLKN